MKTKIWILILMILQILLWALGVSYLIHGELFFGLFITILNTIGFTINVYTLIRLNNEQ